MEPRLTAGGAEHMHMVGSQQIRLSSLAGVAELWMRCLSWGGCCLLPAAGDAVDPGPSLRLGLVLVWTLALFDTLARLEVRASF